MGGLTSPGHWAGGFAAWDELGSYLATGRGDGDGGCSRWRPTPSAALAGEWFAFGVHFIRGYVGTVRRVETHAREREALVALGTLAAGLAHELNNPASAATRGRRLAAAAPPRACMRR